MAQNVYVQEIEGSDTVIRSKSQEGLNSCRTNLAYLTSIVDDNDVVMSEIYMVRNIINNKMYIGQAASHRLNKGRYRPFGAVKRLDSHISQALCNSESKPCADFHVALRAEGRNSFELNVLMYCPLREADFWETFYINELSTFIPSGYNMTSGGRYPAATVMRTREERAVEIVPLQHIPRAVGDTQHNDETKGKIGEGVKAYFESAHGATARLQLIANVRMQHLAKKYDVGMPFTINPTDIESYLSIRKKKVAVLFEQKNSGKKVDFHRGKEETMDACRQRAIDFLKELVRRQQKQLEEVKN